MLVLATIVFAAAPACWAQESVAASVAQEPVSTPATQSAPPVVSRDTVPAAKAEPQAATPGESQAQFLTVPAGTRISLTLANPIKPKGARRGDSVHAVTAFPVTVNEQVVIPSGVLVEGVVDKLIKKDRWGHPWVQVHFTRMVFPNGYVLPLEGQSTEAQAQEPSEDLQAAAPIPDTSHENGPSAGDPFEFQFPQPPPQQPTLPPLPQPNYGPAIALGVSGVAAMVAIAVLSAHHRYDNFWYAVGYQFDMVLLAAVKVDAAAWDTGPGN